MTEEQKINAKVAECCGWRLFLAHSEAVCPDGSKIKWHRWVDSRGNTKDFPEFDHHSKFVPEFTESRDAMAAALETLREQDWPLFIVKLAELTGAILFLRDGADFTRKMMRATPKQLAIAFLSAKGIEI